MKTQPKELYILNFVSMWECFSYYGMRVLLVLFMIHEFNLTDSEAFSLYAVYTTLVELGGVFGGIIADRFLGLKRTILFGGWTIVCGHLSLIIPESQLCFYLGLGLIITGTGLFRSNIPALIGRFYEENDPRRDAGYTLYYTGINLGGFLAALLCGIVGEIYGWHAGFGLAAFGMILGMLVFGVCLKKQLNRDETLNPVTFKPSPIANICLFLGIVIAAPLAGLAVYSQAFIAPLFPVVIMAAIYYVCKQAKNCTQFEKKGLITIGASILFLIIFYGYEEQIGSTLILFAERHIDRETLFGVVPSSSLVTFNPLTILILGPLLARLLEKITLSISLKIAMSFVFLSGAFALLYGGSFGLPEDGMLSIAYLIGSIFLISLGELFIGPTVYAVASQNSPKALQGLVMGMITLGYSLSNLFSGFLSQMMAITEETANLSISSLSVYRDGFLLMTVFGGSIAFSLLIFNQLTKKSKVVL